MHERERRAAAPRLYTLIAALPYSGIMTINLKGTFVRLANYNARANDELYDALSKLTGRARRRDTGSWFESLHGSLNHVLVADLFWLKRFAPIFPESTVLRDPRLSPPNLSWQHDLHDDFEGLHATRRIVDERLVAWFEECPEARYDAAFEYLDSAGNRRHAVAWNAFHFLFVHETHHRGQISQVLDEIGIPNNVADNGRFLEELG